MENNLWGREFCDKRVVERQEYKPWVVERRQIYRNQARHGLRLYRSALYRWLI